MTSLPFNRNPIAFEDLVFRKHVLKPLRKRQTHDVVGLDTETLDGYARLLCSSSGSYIRPKSFLECLRFLTSREFRGRHNFFYNLHYDVQAMLKFLVDMKRLTVLVNEEKNVVAREVSGIVALKMIYRTGRLDMKDYTILYIPKKIFRITRHKNPHVFYDVAQFYETSLAKAARKILGKRKQDEDIDVKILGSSAPYWKKNFQKILTYCIVDAKLTQKLASVLQLTLKDHLGFYPQAYVSKAGLSKQYFRERCVVPSILNTPKQVLCLAFNSYSGGRFEVLRKGSIKGVRCYDINSAYPYHIQNLPDIETGEWKNTLEYHEDALLGFYLCRVHVPIDRIAPFPFKISKTLTGFPCGDFGTHLTRGEYETAREDVEIEIVQGVEYYDPHPTYPFRDPIRELYAAKSKASKDSYEYCLYKIVMNSLYGASYEKIKQDDGYYVGKLFNPIYASEITANTRMQIWEEMKDRSDSIISLATDGILSERKLHIKTSKKLGGWSRDRPGDLTIIRSGIYRIGDVLKNRGLKKMSHINTPDGEFEDLFEYIEQHPELLKYQIITERPLQMGECIVHSKTKTVEDINIWKEDTYTVDLNTDYKRIWDDEFTTGGELFEREINSVPILL